jgi:hypothetical protein
MGKDYGLHVPVRTTQDGKTTSVEHKNFLGAYAIGSAGDQVKKS